MHPSQIEFDDLDPLSNIKLIALAQCFDTLPNYLRNLIEVSERFNMYLSLYWTRGEILLAGNIMDAEQGPLDAWRLKENGDIDLID